MQSRPGNNIDVVWSPTRDDQFVAFDTELNLYKTVYLKTSSINDNWKKLCDETYAELIASYGENSNPRVVSWQKSTNSECLLAVYFQNHKIQLIEYNENRSGCSRKNSIKSFELKKEFSFKQVRQCSNLAWNPYQENILAAGFSERLRTEHSILVWDVRGSNPLAKFDINTESVIYVNDLTNQAESLGKSSFYMNSSIQKKTETIKPLYETSASETCFSLSWNPHNENILLAGLEHGKSGKLKIFDIKSKNKGGNSVNTKYIQGFTIDGAPNSSQFLAASYHENIVALWDIRMFDKPLYHINEQEQIIKMQWCPTRCGTLATLTKNSASINIHSIKNMSTNSNSNANEIDNVPNQLVVDKTILKYPSNYNNKNTINKTSSTNVSMANRSVSNVDELTATSLMNNFCWYNFDSNKILVVTNSRNIVSINLFDTFILTWSPNDSLCWSSNSVKVNMIDDLNRDGYDFMKLFRERTKADYGLKYEIISIANGNATSISSNSGPFSLLQHTPQLVTSNSSSNPSTSAIPLALTLSSLNGLNTLIRSDFLYNLNNSNLPNEISSDVKYLWKWFETINRLYEIAIPLNPPNTLIRLPPNSRSVLVERYSTRYCGLRALLNDFITKPLNQSDLQITHEERFRCIAYYMCSWDYKEGSISRQFFTNLEIDNQFERACCLALLTQNFEQALEILDTASKADNRYGYLWVALKYSNEQQVKQNALQLSQISLSPSTKSTSSLSDQNNMKKSPYYSLNESFDLNLKNSNDKNTTNSSANIDSNDDGLNLNEYSKLIEYFNNPYLKALFNYIMNKEDAIMKILKDSSILLQDRIGLAVFFMYTPNKQKKLLEYFDYLIEEECIKNADLHGIILTGLGPRCIDLFQAFIDKTNDIQTICNVIIHSPYSDVLQSKQVEYWINCYRELLNRFKFWEKRAKFDVFKMKLLKSQTLVSSLLSSSSTFQHVNSQLLNTRNQFSSNSLQNISSYANNSTINLIHLSCNRCGKNVYSESQYLPINMNTFKFNNSNLNKFNDQLSNILGCLNCSKFLPQCTICLRLMKISMNQNLTTNTNTLSISNPNHLLSGNQYISSPKISIYNMNLNGPLSSNMSNTQLHYQLKSSNDYNNNNDSIDLSNNLNVKIKNNNNENTIKNIKSIFSEENMHFIKFSKFGGFYSFCLQCKHGGHVKHLLSWFKSNKKCPYLHCKCECINIGNEN